MNPLERETSPEGDPALSPLPPLGFTEAALAEIRRRLADYAVDDDGLAFFVITQPGRVGFHVGVGFEPLNSDRPLRTEYDFPLQATDEELERVRGYTIDFRGGRFAVLSNVRVWSVPGPDPDALAFAANRLFLERGKAAFSAPAPRRAPFLARFLLEVPGVQSVVFEKNRCVVLGTPEANRDALQAQVELRLKAYLAHGGRPLPTGGKGA